MRDSSPCEFLFVILCFIESDYSCYIKVLEHLQIVLGCIASSIIPAGTVDRTHKSNKLVRDDPIQIAILNLLVVLILFVVELTKIVPS